MENINMVAYYTVEMFLGDDCGWHQGERIERLCDAEEAYARRVANNPRHKVKLMFYTIDSRVIEQFEGTK